MFHYISETRFKEIIYLLLNLEVGIRKLCYLIHLSFGLEPINLTHGVYKPIVSKWPMMDHQSFKSGQLDLLNSFQVYHFFTYQMKIGKTLQVLLENYIPTMQFVPVKHLLTVNLITLVAQSLQIYIKVYNLECLMLLVQWHSW